MPIIPIHRLKLQHLEEEDTLGKLANNVICFLLFYPKELHSLAGNAPALLAGKLIAKQLLAEAVHVKSAAAALLTALNAVDPRAFYKQAMRKLHQGGN